MEGGVGVGKWKVERGVGMALHRVRWMVWESGGLWRRAWSLRTEARRG